ncbi:MAG: ATP-binding protein [Pedobacter sp.]
MKSAESLYERIVEASPYPVYLCSGEDLVITVANNAALKVWGKDKSILGMRFLHALPEHTEQSLITLIQEVYDSGKADQSIKNSVELLFNDEKKIVIYNYNFQAMRNELGSITGVLCFATDVTNDELLEVNASNEKLVSSNEELAVANEELIDIQERMREQAIEKQVALDRLKAQEGNIKNMVNQAPVGMCIVQGDPLYAVEVNDIFLNLIGKTREELSVNPFWTVNAEIAVHYEPIINNVFATGTSFHADEHEMMLIRSGKEEIVNVDFVYEPMLDEQNKAYAIMIVGIDVTDKVVARKKLQRAEESLRLAMEAAGLGSFSINPATKEFKVSPSMKTFFGVDSNESISFETAINQIHEDYRSMVVKNLEAVFTNNTKFDMEYPILGYSDGQTRWVRAVGRMQNVDGTEALTGVLNDITEKRKDEERKNDFIGMVSHELKTPLTSMRGYVQMLLLKMRKQDDEFVVSSLEKTNTQIGKMTTMINGFLNVSRLESGKIHIDHKLFDLAQLVKETEEESLNTISSHKIIFAPVETTMVNADRDKIGQVINNLISNAVKYSVAGTTIYVACVTVGTRALISVRDEGMGIKPQDASKIFERYYRVEGTQMFSISGFGIGLYLCAEIIHRHEGEIWVDSDFGRGSTFSFSLPVVSPETDQA